MMTRFKVIVCLIVIGLSFSFSEYKNIEVEWREGDIVFQDGESSQAAAIKIATSSNFSHCGIVFKEKGNWYVLEAVHPVRIIPIQDWIDQGSDGEYEVKRLRDQTLLTDEKRAAMRLKGKSFIGKNYDIQFGWGDDKLYCSELVWKIYKRCLNIELGKLRPLKEYNLGHPIVRKKLEERYGTKIPLDTKMISPQDIYDSDLLE